MFEESKQLEAAELALMNLISSGNFETEGTAQSQLLEHIVLEHILFITECCIRKNFLQILPLLLVFILFLSSVRLSWMFDAFFILCLCWALPLSVFPKVFLRGCGARNLGFSPRLFSGKFLIREFLPEQTRGTLRAHRP